MITAGLDVGTKDTCAVLMEDGKIKDHLVLELKEGLDDLIKFLRENSPEAIGCGFGYGLPVKRLSDLEKRDLLKLILSFEKPILGVRSLVESLKEKFGKISYTIPSVKLLPTVPYYRKLNRVDMGTSDKVCSVALAISTLRDRGLNFVDQNFVLVEAGYGFNAFLAVKGGKIVDGLGGSSGFISFSSSGSLDLEIVALLKSYPKENVFKGGFKSFFPYEIESIPERVLEYFFEYVMKGIKVMEVSIGFECDVILSGRFFDVYYKDFVDYSGLKCLKLKRKSSAEGACVIANGLIGGKFRDVVDHLELKRAEGDVFDYISEDLRKIFKYDI